MSAALTASVSAPEARLAPRRVAPIWRAAEAAAASLVTRPAMARDEVSASAAAVSPLPGRVARLAALAAGAAFAGSTVGLAFFLSRKPLGSTGDHDVKFRA